MRMTPRALTMVAAATLAFASAPAVAAAQQHLQPVRVSPSDALARAEGLHGRGRQAGDSLNRMKHAAKLHEGSAELRVADDPQRTACLREAALLRYYSGDRTGASRIMVRAAESAAERGDVITAAQAYSDAAIITHELRQPARAWELGVRAEVLTGSPLLTESQRLALRERIVRLDRGARVVMAAGRTLAATHEHP